jgi:hypothetical protein
MPVPRICRQETLLLTGQYLTIQNLSFFFNSAQSNYSTPVKNTTLEVIHYTEITKASQPSNLSDAPTAVQHPPKEKEKSAAVVEADNTIVVKRRASSDLIPVPEGSLVEGNYRGKGVWFPGTVLRAFEGLGVDGGRGNALYDIQYDDGEVERGMEAWYVRVKAAAAVEPVRTVVAAAPQPLCAQPVSQPSTAAPAAVGSQKPPVQSNLTAVFDSAAVKGDDAAVLSKATAPKHTDTATSVPVSLGTEKKAIVTATAAANAAASRAVDDTPITTIKAVFANTASTATENANTNTAAVAKTVASTVAATSSSQPSATTTAVPVLNGVGGAQNKAVEKVDPSRPTGAATAPSAATVQVPSQINTANGSTAANAVPATSASASSWAKTTPSSSSWAQKPEGEGVKGPARPLSAAPSRSLVIDTAHRRGSDPESFDDSTESVDKGLKGNLGMGLDPKAKGFSAQPVKEVEGVIKQPVVQKDAVAVKEMIKGVRGEVVPPLKLSVVMDEIKEGSLVEGNYAEIGEWFTGKITKKRSDGSYDILYDDGDVELGVRPPLVRLRR